MNADDTSSTEFRPATEADADVIVRMMEDFNQIEGIAYSVERLHASYRELLAHPEIGAIFVAEVGGVPSAYSVLAYSFDFEFGGRDAFVCELFVLERHRGRGIGKELLDFVEAFARSQGVHALHLIVRRENRAQILYRRTGFNFDPRLLMTKAL